jgi:predicted nucleic acid-binding protein
MRTAIDTSVLISIFSEEHNGQKWIHVLEKARSAGPLLVSETVFAELSSRISSLRDLKGALEDHGIAFDSINEETAFRAGRMFGQYRAQGGPRTRMIPDFLVAAHAMVQGDRLATLDRGYFRNYFNDLELLTLD